MVVRRQISCSRTSLLLDGKRGVCKLRNLTFDTQCPHVPYCQEVRVEACYSALFGPPTRFVPSVRLVKLGQMVISLRCFLSRIRPGIQRLGFYPDRHLLRLFQIGIYVVNYGVPLAFCRIHRRILSVLLGLFPLRQRRSSGCRRPFFLKLRRQDQIVLLGPQLHRGLQSAIPHHHQTPNTDDDTLDIIDGVPSILRQQLHAQRPAHDKPRLLLKPRLNHPHERRLEGVLIRKRHLQLHVIHPDDDEILRQIRILVEAKELNGPFVHGVLVAGLEGEPRLGSVGEHNFVEVGGQAATPSRFFFFRAKGHVDGGLGGFLPFLVPFFGGGGRVGRAGGGGKGGGGGSHGRGFFGLVRGGHRARRPTDVLGTSLVVRRGHDVDVPVIRRGGSGRTFELGGDQKAGEVGFLLFLVFVRIVALVVLPVVALFVSLVVAVVDADCISVALFGIGGFGGAGRSVRGRTFERSCHVIVFSGNFRGTDVLPAVVFASHAPGRDSIAAVSVIGGRVHGLDAGDVGPTNVGGGGASFHDGDVAGQHGIVGGEGLMNVVVAMVVFARRGGFGGCGIHGGD
mmetsp:Transcript_26483/g.53989  ORF Transcript_26483/g.53989 Transcript_26483/m.53989 type:complete len:567 (+) Transcript_26483:302-2002(+)